MSEINSGSLLYFFLSAVVLTGPVSIVLLLWYRRAVGRLMLTVGVLPVEQSAPENGHQGHGTAPVPQPVATKSILVKPERNAAASEREFGPSGRNRQEVNRRLILVYGVAGALQAAVLTYLELRTSGADSALQIFVTWYVNCWPLLPTTAILLTRPPRRYVRDAVAYLLLGAVLVSFWSSVRYLVAGQETPPWRHAIQFVLLAVWSATAPAVLILVTFNRRIRAVAPAALGTLLAFSLSLLVFFQLIIRAADSGIIEGILLGSMARFGVEPALYGLYLLTSLAVGYVIWWSIQRMAGRYRDGAFSDRQLLTDSCWLIIATYTVAINSASGDVIAPVLLGLLGFAIYRMTVKAGLRLAALRDSPSGTDRLLLLRVFGYQKRTEQLFDAVAQRWRVDGTVQLVAGTDLAMRCFDLGALVMLVGGHLKEQFVRNSADLSRRLSTLAVAPDPDGRYRVNALYCHEDTWRATLLALLQQSDAVLMDLRGFSEKSMGCIFEVQQIIATGPLGRVVFVVDGTTDLNLLQRTLAEAGSKSGLARSDSDAATHSVHVERQSFKAVETLYTLLRGVDPVSELPAR